MAGVEQLQCLTESFAELAKSNSEIREKLERLYNGKKIKRESDLGEQRQKEIQERLHSLQCRQESSDTQLSHLCDQVDKLVDRLDTLRGLTKESQDKVPDKRSKAFRKNEDQKRNEPRKENSKTTKVNTDAHKKPDERKMRNGELAVSERSVQNLRKSETMENDTSKESNRKTKKMMDTKGESKETNIGTEVDIEDFPRNNSPLCRNKDGLRLRKTSLDDDNRSHMSEVRRPRWRKLSSAELESSNVKDVQDVQPSASRSRKPRKEVKVTPRASRPAPSTRNEYKNLAGFMKDIDDTPVEERDLRTWKTMAEAERIQGLTGDAICGKGPSTCLLLDISESMAGRPFRRMIKAAKSYVKQIAEFNENLGIEENIGIATFGHDTGVVQHMTTDYRKVRKCLDMLQPGGPSPMSGGLYMALACCLGIKPTTTIADVIVQAKTILFTDGKGTPDKTVTGDDNVQIGFEDALHIQLTLAEATSDFRQRKLRVFCIQIGDEDKTLLDEIVKNTKSKMYSLEDIDKLARMTNNTVHALSIKSNLSRLPGVEPSFMIDLLLNDLQLPGTKATDTEEIKDIIEYYSENETKSEEDKYTESDQDLLPVGSRVRRGPDWQWGNQDSDCAGTVIGHDKTVRGTVWVEWDSGHHNTYRWSAYQGYDLLPVDEPRVITDSKIKVGCLVVRGRDWTGDDEDGGRGNVGVVTKANEDKRVLVRWPNKKKVIYKCGTDGRFEVEICDPMKVTGDPGNLKVHVWGTGNKLGDEESADTTTSSVEKNSDTVLTEEIGTSNDRNAKRRDDEPSSVRGDIMGTDISRPKEKKIKRINAQWSFESGEDQWTKYPPDWNVKVEKAYGRNSTGSTIIELDGKIYKISFLNMTQECSKTGESKRIKRNEIINID